MGHLESAACPNEAADSSIAQSKAAREPEKRIT
jgi:hypothetical protein